MRLRDLLPFAATLLGLLALGFACSKPECERNVDCGGGFVCTAEGVCQMKVFRPPGEVPDAGPGMLRDMGIRDTGSSTPTPDAGDAGVGPDVDAGDLGPGPDLGTPDSGAGDGGVVRSLGEVVVAEYATGAAPFHIVRGRFVDDVASGIVTYERGFTSGQVTCLLTRQTRPANVTGFAATRILISGFSNGQVQSIELLPSSNGLFLTSQPLGAGLFLGSPDAIAFDIQSNNATGNLGSYQTSVAPPYAFTPAVISPGIGTTIYTQVPPVSVSWSAAALSPGLRIYLELSDAQGAVRLVCSTPDALGVLQVPAAALSAFLAETLAPPVFMELRYQSEVVEDVPIVGRAAGIPTRFRAANGVYWPVQL